MQILETSILGLRSAQIVFRSRDKSAIVSLFPMVHVGEAKFYEDTYHEAFSHDVVLVEGIRSPIGRNLTRSYRWLNFARLGLTVQPKTPPQEAVSARIVKADLTADEFHNEWRKVPIWIRAAFLFGAPFYGLHGRLFATRERLARNMCLEDLRSPDEILSWNPKFAPVYHSIIHARDNRLIECLATELECVPGAEKRIAVVYGARHQRAVVRHLTSRGFYSSGSPWRMIFSFSY